jgi:hypothetical protein
MPIPVIGAVGFVSRIFGSVVKKIRANRIERRAEKAQKKAEALAAKGEMQLRAVYGKLSPITSGELTKAQQTVFDDPSGISDGVMSQAKEISKGSFFQKYGLMFGVLVGVLVLFKILKK